MDPRAGLWFDSDCWHGYSVHIGSSSHIRPGISDSSHVTLEVLHTCDSLKVMTSTCNDDPRLVWKFEWTDHLSAVKKPCGLELLTKFLTDFIKNFKHALLLHSH